MNFAVIIPVFNKERHVERAIASVLSQTLPPAEILIVDDASTDGSSEKLAALSHPLIKVLRRPTPGSGGYAARNMAIEASRAEWISFLDADDAWTPEHLRSVADAIARNNDDPGIGCIFTGYRNMYQDGIQVLDRYSRRCGRICDQRLDFVALLKVWLHLKECPVWTSAASFRRDVFAKAGLFPDGRCSRGGDKDLWLRVARQTDLLACPNVTAMYYRDSMNMVTRNSTTNVRHCLCETIENLLAEEKSETVRKLLMRLFNTEVFEYAKFALRTERVNPQVWRGFHISQDPFRFAALLTFTFLPYSVSRLPYLLKQALR